jgi:hypothetical protein
MATELRGKVTLEGVSGTVTYAALVSPGALEVLSGGVTDQADVQKRPAGNSEHQGYRIRNRRKEFSVVCLITVASGTARADALKAAIFPLIPSLVTLASFEESAASRTGLSSVINGDYVYEGGASAQYEDDYVRMTIPLVKYDHQTATNLVAAVT